MYTPAVICPSLDLGPTWDLEIIMVNQTMPIGSTGTHYMDKMLTIRYVAPSLDSI